MGGHKNPGMAIYSAQFKQYEGLVCNMLEFLRSNGGEILDQKTGQVLIDQAPALEAISFVRNHIIGKAAPRGVVTYEEPGIRSRGMIKGFVSRPSLASVL